MSLLDLLFPKYCVRCRKMGAYVCAGCFVYISFLEKGFCTVCQRQSIDYRTHPYCKTKYTIDGVFPSVAHSGVIKKLIYQFKYKPHVADLKKFLTELMYEGLIQKELFYSILTPDSVLVPIPLYKTRLRTRGYNQSALLAAGLARQFSLRSEELLRRVKDTHTQVNLSQAQRRENIKDAFMLNNALGVKLPKQVFLVDDIVTSGATLAEAAKTLKKAGVEKVWGIALAHGK